MDISLDSTRPLISGNDSSAVPAAPELDGPDVEAVVDAVGLAAAASAPPGSLRRLNIGMARGIFRRCA